MPAFVNRDAQGREIFRFDQSIVRLVGYHMVNGGTTSGRIDITDSIPGSPFYFYTPSENQQYAQNTGNQVRLEGRSIIWSGMPVGTVIRFGVY